MTVRPLHCGRATADAVSESSRHRAQRRHPDWCRGATLVGGPEEAV